MSLEGAFWSLYVEFKFYLMAGAVYFLLGRKFLIPCLTSFFMVWLLVVCLSSFSDLWVLTFLKKISLALSFDYYGWFTAGALFYLYTITKNNRYFYSGVILTVLSSLFVKADFNLAIIIAAITVSALFSFSILSKRLQRILQSRSLLFLGFVSYPLYLLHENAMISIIINIPQNIPWVHPLLYPLFPLTLLCFISYFITKYFEPKTRHIINKATQLSHSIMSTIRLKRPE